MALNPNDPKFKAFISDPFPGGIDLKRSVIGRDLGVYVADPAATFRAGQVLAQNASGQLIVCDGTSGAVPSNVPFAIAKWTKASSYLSTVVDEPIVLNGVAATNLKHANLFGSAPGVAVRSAPDMGGTAYTEGGGSDFTVNYTNGQVTRVGGGTIADGATVYVTYTYFVTEADLDFKGRNFFNFTDDVTIQQGRIAAITDWSIVFTTMFDPARTYSIQQPLHVDGGARAGLFTNQTGGGRPVFGRVFQLPSADDPFLGIVTPGHA
jgi:hypothetical protein